MYTAGRFAVEQQMFEMSSSDAINFHAMPKPPTAQEIAALALSKDDKQKEVGLIRELPCMYVIAFRKDGC